MRPDPRDEVARRLIAEAERACPELPDLAGASEWDRWRLVDYGHELAGLVQAGRNCPLRPALALRIARTVAPFQRWESLNAHRLLAALYERGIGVRADPARALAEKRLAWLLWPSPPAPFADDAERDLYLARPATIAFLRPYAAAEGQLQAQARLRLAQALHAQGPQNRAEVLTLLAGQSQFEAVLLRARLQLGGDDEAARAAALAALRRMAIAGEGKEPARAMLRDYVRATLAATPTAEQREEAIASLAAIAWDLDWRTVAELMAAVREANGGRPPATASDAAAQALRRRLAPHIGPDDYPAAGMRADEEGTVRLRALIGPSGRILFTEPLITGPEQPWTLVREVRRLYATRPLRPVDLGADLSTPYMWIRLPDVHFRMDD